MCWSRKSVPWASTLNWNAHKRKRKESHEVITRPVQAIHAGRAFRCHPHRHGIAREDPLVVFRRGEEARDHQLPDLQARARRPVLRQDLRPDQGLRVPVWQVQAPEAPRRDL
ncbi:hypothetical protein VARIO8X_130203 [Burkholderiales bacterium 8X]|nr:hypothetical protein VARIO8X_130203 [Burkholderiales bacterium 8X]